MGKPNFYGKIPFTVVVVCFGNKIPKLRLCTIVKYYWKDIKQTKVNCQRRT